MTGAVLTTWTGHTLLVAAARPETVRHWPETPVRPAGDGAVAAARPAAGDPPEMTDPAALHARPVSAARRTAGGARYGDMPSRHTSNPPYRRASARSRYDRFAGCEVVTPV
ncbi:hypothetical protein ACFHWY_25465, partial [Micromonospora sp. LOL_024]